MTKAAIIILNFNGKHFLEKFLPSVMEHSGIAEVIVADNKSTDHSVQFLQNSYPEIRIIQNPVNGGFAKGYNDALKEVESKYYILLNSDVEVSEKWIEPILKLMDSDEQIAACQPKILSFKNKSHLEYAGAAGGFIDILGYPFCKGRIFDTVEEDQPEFNKTYPIFWASGAALFIRSEIYHAIEGFDEDFFAHMEEIDLCWKINRLGKKIYYCGESKVYHVGGGTLPMGNPRKTYLNFKNSLITLYTNSRYSDLFWKIPLRFAFDLLAIFKFLFSFDIGSIKAILQADWDFLTSRKEIRGKRNNFLNKYPIVNSPYQYNGFIVLDYFLKKRTKWHDFEFLKTKNKK
ncbi:glycosyltransferase family 2 protein [Aureibacter tunicatorum]|uniref:Glycosyltransferase 2-like domain-containing protein n=1 Tax=Aureibacter tunicatorum TaxID=866807 RepID=A0AAE4BSB0_9BACT|nr:glycosyltransferase family 2 protein [Aureibacter tunicatorum]MDR6238182.1 hypothetical protein [Aureibacter tunicatorum]BDD03215.1 glycosyl transferase family 2 [Aureibacter tunicatorum]